MMTTYPKINSIYKRHSETNKLRMGEYAQQVYRYLEDNDWIAYEKIDGMNVRCHWDGSTIKFAGRTDNAQIPAPLLVRLLEIFTAEKLTFVFGSDPIDVTIFGEGFGGNIQNPVGKRYNPDGKFDFIMFDVRIGDWWIRYSDMMEFADSLETKLVPIIAVKSLREQIESIKYGVYSKVAEDKAFYAEGIVCRPLYDILTRNGQRVITKIKYKDFQNIGME